MDYKTLQTRFKLLRIYKNFFKVCADERDDLEKACQKNDKKINDCILINGCDILLDTNEGEAKRVGFPNTIVTPLDETTQLLYERFDDISLYTERYKIWIFHFPQKGDETRLLYWHSLKAKAYLDMQAMLIKIAENKGLHDLISRIFVFPSDRHIKDFELSAFMTFFEQVNMGVNCYLTTKNNLKDINNDLFLICKNTLKIDMVCVDKKDHENPYGNKFNVITGVNFRDLKQIHNNEVVFLNNLFEEKNNKIELKEDIFATLKKVDFSFSNE